MYQKQFSTPGLLSGQGADSRQNSDRFICLLRYSVIAMAIFAAGCASQPSKTAAAPPSPFYLGADISTLSEVEQRGGVYMDGDKPGDALAIFMKNGWTCFRLRI